jgi:hypothetical protein
MIREKFFREWRHFIVIPFHILILIDNFAFGGKRDLFVLRNLIPVGIFWQSSL